MNIFLNLILFFHRRFSSFISKKFSFIFIFLFISHSLSSISHSFFSFLIIFSLLKFTVSHLRKKKRKTSQIEQRRISQTLKCRRMFLRKKGKECSKQSLIFHPQLNWAIRYNKNHGKDGIFVFLVCNVLDFNKINLNHSRILLCISYCLHHKHI